MYSKIKELQDKGFSVRKTAKYLKISRDTVSKYRAMELDDFIDLSESVRKLSQLDNYKQIILDWLYDYPSMTAAQVHDWLLEHYSIAISERSVSRYVKHLREEYAIAKTKQPRDYEAVDELPPGYQMQLDFGVKNMPLETNGALRKFTLLALYYRTLDINGATFKINLLLH